MRSGFPRGGGEFEGVPSQVSRQAPEGDASIPIKVHQRCAIRINLDRLGM
jgi:hypothetical protein